jgi:hypothetical protein
METQETLRIMRALADGINPESGEVLTANAVYHDPPVVRAFHRAARAWNTWKNASVRRRRHRRSPARRGRGRKMRKFVRSCAGELIFQQIATTHNRAISSIVARLVKLGKIEPNTPLDMLDPRVA